jgi:hypothetical protein
MTTPLHNVLKRSLQIDGREYVATLTPELLKLTLRGKRNGIELKWAELVGGEAALAVALHASIGAIDLADKVVPRARAVPSSRPLQPPKPSKRSKPSKAQKRPPRSLRR